MNQMNRKKPEALLKPQQGNNKPSRKQHATATMQVQISADTFHVLENAGYIGYKHFRALPSLHESHHLLPWLQAQFSAAAASDSAGALGRGTAQTELRYRPVVTCLSSVADVRRVLYATYRIVRRLGS